jgi:hypothetical protein
MSKVLRLLLNVAKSQILLLLFISEASALYQLRITNRQYINGGVPAVLDPIADSLELQFNSTLAGSDNAEFLTQVGNANAGATRSFLAPGVIGEATTKHSVAFGLGGSYSGGTSASTGANSLPSVGAAGHTGITLGANGEIIKIFRGLNPKKVMYFVSFYTMDLSRFFNDRITIDSLQASVGLTYPVYSPREWIPGVRFNGIQVSSGLAYGNFNGSYTTPFTSSSGGVNMQSNVTLNVDSDVFTFSNEATTGLRFFYVLDLFLGLGIDFNVGSTALSGTTSGGAVSASDAGGTTVFTGDTTLVGTPESSTPSAAQLRFIMGTQVNMGPIVVYGQAHVSTPAVYSLNLGARVSF